MHLINHFIQKEGNQDPVTIAVIGAGGNGSHFLYSLAALQNVLYQIRGQELAVMVYDDDLVEKHNCGRQLFFEQEIGMSKSRAIIQRINRSYGYSWEFREQKMKSCPSANIVVTCTDNIASRKIIEKARSKTHQHRYHNHYSNLYWLDMGNDRNSGNVILSTFVKSGNNSLKSVFEIFPELMKKKEDNKPSCGMLESLMQQDVFINKIIATLAAKMLKTLFLDSTTNHHGIFVDIENPSMTEIPC